MSSVLDNGSSPSEVDSLDLDEDSSPEFSIVSELIDEAIVSVCFDIHRSSSVECTVSLSNQMKKCLQPQANLLNGDDDDDNYFDDDWTWKLGQKARGEKSSSGHTVSSMPQHSDEQRQSVRLLLLGYAEVEPPVGRLRPDGSSLEPDDVIDVDSYEDGDGQALRDTLNRLSWEEESNVVNRRRQLASGIW
ncbi:Ataxin-7-like protein 3 [Desmophyllum pertusum]|uniref:Ataxin-7-like protein 3 n=1 Tax=Desmophyllum pertusum TaxID=174260 RepID=A0A9W9ZUT6_9CNID|nr:Ataxin-7-like protein 3 [Desmophyllum pertusum]